LNRKRKADWYVVAIHLFLFISIVAWTQTRSVNPVQVKKKTPAITFLNFSGKSAAMKLSPSQVPSPPPALTRSDRINAIALARKAGNVQSKSLAAEPRPKIILTASASISGPNYFEFHFGHLYSIHYTHPGEEIRPNHVATLSPDPDSHFVCVFTVIPGKTYLADFHVSNHSGPWTVLGAEINSDNGHLLVAFRADSPLRAIILRHPYNNTSSYGTLYGPGFFKVELTQID